MSDRDELPAEVTRIVALLCASLVGFGKGESNSAVRDRAKEFERYLVKAK